MPHPEPLTSYSLCRQLGIVLRYISPYAHQEDGSSPPVGMARATSGREPYDHLLNHSHTCVVAAVERTRPQSAKLIESAVSDGVEDQGAESAFMRPRENYHVRFGSRLPCERLSFSAHSSFHVVC